MFSVRYALHFCMLFLRYVKSESHSPIFKTLLPAIVAALTEGQAGEAWEHSDVIFVLFLLSTHLSVLGVGVGNVSTQLLIQQFQLLSLLRAKLLYNK
jgi:hypothetical protein